MRRTCRHFDLVTQLCITFFSSLYLLAEQEREEKSAAVRILVAYLVIHYIIDFSLNDKHV